MYRKVAPDLMLATNRGGFFSIMAMAFMGYLAFMETWAFIGAGPVAESIDASLGLSPLRLNIDLEFPRLRCEDATVELYRGKTRATIRGLEQTLRVQRHIKSSSALGRKSKRTSACSPPRSWMAMCSAASHLGTPVE